MNVNTKAQMQGAASTTLKEAFFYKPGARAAGPLAMWTRMIDAEAGAKLIFSIWQLVNGSKRYVRQGGAADVTAEDIGNGNGSTVTFTPTLASNPVPGTVVITATVGGSPVLLKDVNRDGKLYQGPGYTTQRGTVNYFTKAVSITYATAPDNSTDILAAYKVAKVVKDGVDAMMLERFLADEELKFDVVANTDVSFRSHIVGHWL